MPGVLGKARIHYKTGIIRRDNPRTVTFLGAYGILLIQIMYWTGAAPVDQVVILDECYPLARTSVR